jgi:hypothetical protein
MEDGIDYKRVAKVWSEKLCHLMGVSSGGCCPPLHKEMAAIAGLLRELAKEDRVGVFCSMAEIADTAIQTIHEQKKAFEMVTGELKKENKRLEDELIKLQRAKARAEHRAYLAEKRVADLLATAASSETEFVVHAAAPVDTTTSRRNREVVNGATSPIITTRWRDEEV